MVIKQTGDDTTIIGSGKFVLLFLCVGVYDQTKGRAAVSNLNLLTVGIAQGVGGDLKFGHRPRNGGWGGMNGFSTSIQ